MFDKKEVQRLRNEMGDTRLMNHLYRSDETFKRVVDRVKGDSQNLTALEKAKLPSYLIDRVYNGSFYPEGKRKPAPSYQRTMASVNQQQRGLMQERERGLLDTVPVEEASVAGFGKNLLTSSARLAKDVAVGVGKTALGAGVKLVEGVTPLEFDDPLGSETAIEGLGKLALGTGINIAEVITQNEDLFSDPFGAETIASSVGDFYVERYGSIEDAKRTAFEDPAGFASDLALVLGGTSAALRGVGQASKFGAVGKVGKKVGAVGRAIDPVKVPGRIARKIKHVDDIPEQILAKDLKLKPSLVKKVRKQYGARPEKFLVERGIFGSADEIANTLDEWGTITKGKVDNGLAAIDDVFDVATGAKPAGQALDLLDEVFNGTVGNDDVIATIKSLKSKKSLTLSEMNQVKRLLDNELDIFTRAGDVKGGTQARGLKNIRDGIKEFIEVEADKRGFDDVKILNKETQVSREIGEAIKDTLDRTSSNRAMSLTDFLTVGAGAGAGGPLGAGGALLAKKIAESQRVRTAVARAMAELPDEKFTAIRLSLEEGASNPVALRAISELIKDPTVANAIAEIEQQR